MFQRHLSTPEVAVSLPISACLLSVTALVIFGQSNFPLQLPSDDHNLYGEESNLLLRHQRSSAEDDEEDSSPMISRYYTQYLEEDFMDCY
jgi:hypothetical protein